MKFAVRRQYGGIEAGELDIVPAPLFGVDRWFLRDTTLMPLPWQPGVKAQLKTCYGRRDGVVGHHSLADGGERNRNDAVRAGVSELTADHGKCPPGVAAVVEE